eukprot:5617629-Pleurochrysis_carterae.AAC.1
MCLLEATFHHIRRIIWRKGKNVRCITVFYLHSKSTVDFIGYDGLRHSRLIHKPFQDPTQFLKTAPVVIHEL